MLIGQGLREVCAIPARQDGANRKNIATAQPAQPVSTAPERPDQTSAGGFCFGYRFPKNFLRASAAASFEFVLFAALASGGSPAG